MSEEKERKGRKNKDRDNIEKKGKKEERNYT